MKYKFNFEKIRHQLEDITITWNEDADAFTLYICRDQLGTSQINGLDLIHFLSTGISALPILESVYEDPFLIVNCIATSNYPTKELALREWRGVKNKIKQILVLHKNVAKPKKNKKSSGGSKIHNSSLSREARK